MARSSRFQYPGALYDVMARGDGGKTVFENKDDCAFHGSGISSARHIFLASRSGISEWGGTGARRPVLGF